MLTDRQIPLDKLKSMRAGHIKVLIGLYCYADAFGVCWPGLRTLAADLNCSINAVRQSLEEMASLDHLIVEKQPKGRSTRYRIAAHLLGSIRHLSIVEETNGESHQDASTEKDARQLEFFYLFKKSPKPRKPITSETRERVLRKGNGCCWYCGWKLDSEAFEVDHVVPLVMGGSDDLSNFVPTCSLCNGHKGGEDLDRFRAKIQRLSGNSDRHLFFFERDPEIEDPPQGCSASVAESDTEREEKEFKSLKKSEAIPLGRDAPPKEPTAAAPLSRDQEKEIKERKAQKWRERVVRFVQHRYSGHELQLRLLGLMGEDPIADATSWYEVCNTERIAADWDDVRDRRNTGRRGFQRVAAA